MGFTRYLSSGQGSRVGINVERSNLNFPCQPWQYLDSFCLFLTFQCIMRSDPIIKMFVHPTNVKKHTVEYVGCTVTFGDPEGPVNLKRPSP